MARDEGLRRAIAAKEAHEASLWAYPNVTAIGVARRRVKGERTDEWAVQVRVRRKLPASRLRPGGRLPREVAGPDGVPVRVDVVQSGPFVACSGIGEYRPVIGGVSIGHAAGMDFGTLGGWACDRLDDTSVLLTCNHAIANLDRRPSDARIVQPARSHDGLVFRHSIGTLKRFRKITIDVSPLPVSPVDAAIGTISEPWSPEVRDIGGGIFETGTAADGDRVRKCGAVTDVRSGRVDGPPIHSVDVRLPFLNEERKSGEPATLYKRARIGHSFVVESDEAFSAHGDSGALVFADRPGVVASTLPVVGLLYAQDPEDDRIGYCNDISAVFRELSLTTLCDSAARAMLGMIAAGSSSRLRGHLARLRGLQARVLRTSALGERLDDFLTREAARVSRVLAADNETLDLAARALAPWLGRGSDRDLLDAPIDRAQGIRLHRLVDRLGDCEPTLRRSFAALKAALAVTRGQTTRDLLATVAGRVADSGKRR